MRMHSSRPALALTALAAATMVATPALARGWHGPYGRHYRHNNGIDGGDVLAGVLIIGGIAAIASAASSAGKRGRESTRGEDAREGEGARAPYPGGPVAGDEDGADYGADYRGSDDRSPSRDYPGGTGAHDGGWGAGSDTARGADYGEEHEPEARYGGRDVRTQDDSGRNGAIGVEGLDDAVDACVSEVQRGQRSVETVETADRAGNGFHVEGRMKGGAGFECAIAGDGRVTSATVDGQAAF